MKALTKFDNRDKLKTLHELFPEEVPLILDNILAFCVDFEEHKEEYKKNWTGGLLPFDYWFALSEETAIRSKKFRSKMIKSSSVFSNLFTYTYAVLFVNDRIVKYADKVSTNEKFKLAVNLLFNP